MDLSNQEKKVLIALKKEAQLTAKELIKSTGMNQGAVNKTIAWLEEKGLIQKTETIKERYELDEEGKRYLENGLPERKLIEEIKNKPASIKDLIKKYGAETVKIGSIWLRKLNAGMIIQGQVQITPTGKRYLNEKMPLEKALEKISKGEAPEKEEINQLKKRGKTIKVIEEKTVTVELTKKGTQVVSGNLKIEEEITKITPEILRTKKWRTKKIREYDVTAPVPVIHPGKKQIYYEYLDEVREKMIAMGFKEMKGNIVQTEFWNFDVLFQPQNHPARTETDTYYLKSPRQGEIFEEKLKEKVKQAHENGIDGSEGRKEEWSENKAKNLILRSHTTCLSVKKLYEEKSYPLKYFSIGRNFRRDVIDASHLPEFNQLEGIVADESLTLRDLLSLLETFATEVAGIKDKKSIKFKAAYFPYTEPSVEIFAKHDTLGWIELGGSGMFRPEVLKPLDVEVPVIAWGLGIGRLAMFALKLKHIRDLFSQDLKLLQEKTYIREM